jgi:beta-lactamase regulating signal transducer with metallopeptidase domain
MNALFEIAMSNVLMAGALAVPATLAGLWGRRPALTHGLWLLVLLKLVTPPLFQVPVSWPELVTPAPEPPPRLAALPEPMADTPVLPVVEDPPAGQEAVDEPQPADLAAGVPIRLVPEGPVGSEPQAAEMPPVAVAPVSAAAVDIAWTTWLGGLGLTGSAVWLVLATWRLARFKRLLRFACRAPDTVQQEARALAETMGVRCPQVLLMPAAISPMLWVGRSPRLLLPEGLVARLRPQQLATVMAHELAHWRRGDHRVRWLEMLALCLYWWCPLAWWARRQLQQAEEECCDAWVVAVLPEAARDYALALVDTIDFLSGASAPLPPVASGVGHVRLLKRRLTMILRGTTPQSLTRAGLLGVAGLGLFLLPFVPGRAQQPAEKIALDKAVDFLAQTQRNQGTAGPANLAQDLDKVRQLQQDLEKRHQALEEQRRHVELQLKELAAALQQMKAQGKAETTKPASPSGPGIGFTGGVAKFPMSSGTIAYQPAPAGGKSAGVEQRLEQVERKLDALLWEITNMRRDMSTGHAPGGFGGGMGGFGGGMMGGSGGAPGKAFPPGGAPPAFPGRPGGPGGAGAPGGPMGGGAPQFSPDPAPQAQPGTTSASDALPKAFPPPSDAPKASPQVK